MLSSFFEGPEKKLEIILSGPIAGLRDNNDKKWDKTAKAARANIISKANTAGISAYLLSESSLFVWDDRILLITCGKTRLVEALPEILKIVDKKNIAFVFYEQKNFLFPDDQPSSFEEDVKLVEKYFPGKYYKLGPVNYDHVNVFYSSHGDDPPEEDATLQILMHNLNPGVIKLFYSKMNKSRVDIKKITGIGNLYKMDMITDEYFFSPSGYSLNSLNGSGYFTIHVTPQPAGSYVSFETNIVEKDYRATIDKVISIFRPERFSLLLTTGIKGCSQLAHKTLYHAAKNYLVTDKSLYEFDCGYNVTFLNYRISDKTW